MAKGKMELALDLKQLMMDPDDEICGDVLETVSNEADKFLIGVGTLSINNVNIFGKRFKFELDNNFFTGGEQMIGITVKDGQTEKCLILVDPLKPLLITRSAETPDLAIINF